MEYRYKSVHAVGRALMIATLSVVGLANCYSSPTIAPTDITHTTNPDDPNDSTGGTSIGPMVGVTIQPSVDGGKCLQVQTNDGAMGIGVASCTGKAAQRWVYTGGALKNLQSKQCLDVTGDEVLSADATLSVQACDTARTSQAWIADRGIFYADNGNAQFSIALNANPPSDGTKVKLGPVNFNDAAQKWAMDIATPGDSGQNVTGFHITPNATPTACLDVDPNSHLVTNPCSDADSQKWNWLVTGLLQSGSTCISLPTDPNATQPLLVPCDATVPAELWISTGGQFVNNAVTKCADATGKEDANGAVLVNACNGAPTQQWTFGAAP